MIECSNEVVDALAVDPGLDFGLDRYGDLGNLVSGDSASEEGSEAVSGSGFVEGFDDGFEGSEVMREGGEVRVGGED